MRSGLLLLGVLLVLPDHAIALPPQQAAPVVYTQRFGTRYLTGRVGLKPFIGLTIAEDRIIVTTSKRKGGFYVEAFAIPLASITSTEVTRDKRDDEVAQLLLGGSWTNNYEYLTIVTEGPTVAEGLVFQVTQREGAGIVAKINFAIKQLKARTEPATPTAIVVPGAASIVDAQTIKPLDATTAQTVRQGTAASSVIPNVFQSPMIIETVFAATDRAHWGKKGWFTIPAYQALGQSTCDGVALRQNVRGEFRGGVRWDAGLMMRAKAAAGDLLEVTIGVSLWNPRGNHDKAVTLVFEVLSDPPFAPIVMGPMQKKDNGLDSGWTRTFTVPIRSLNTDPQTPMRITMTTKDY